MSDLSNINVEIMAVRTLNRAFLIGNIVRKPELMLTKRNTGTTTFHLITNREWTTSRGEYKTESTRHVCMVWDKLADRAVKLLETGTLVYVEGRMDTKVDVDELGHEISQMVVVVDNFIVLSQPAKEEYYE